MQNDLVNTFGLAAALKLPRSWLIDEADAGRIPFLRVGKLRMFNPEAVERVLAERAASAPYEAHPTGKGADRA